MRSMYVYHMLVTKSSNDSRAEVISGEEQLAGYAEVSVGMSLPAPLSQRLDELVRAAEAAGERTSRKEVVASLVLAARLNGAALSDDIRRFRSASVSEAVVPDANGRVHLTPRGPGPRVRSS